MGIIVTMSLHGSIRLHSLRFTTAMTNEVNSIRYCVDIRCLSDLQPQISLIFLRPDADTDIDRR